MARQPGGGGHFGGSLPPRSSQQVSLRVLHVSPQPQPPPPGPPESVVGSAAAAPVGTASVFLRTGTRSGCGLPPAQAAWQLGVTLLGTEKQPRQEVARGSSESGSLACGHVRGNRHSALRPALLTVMVTAGPAVTVFLPWTFQENRLYLQPFGHCQKLPAYKLTYDRYHTSLIVK